MDAQIINLAELAAACQPLARWWESFIVTGEPRLKELDAARRSLRSIDAVSGRIGRALRELDEADATDPDQLVNAVEVLCRVALIADAAATSRIPPRRPPSMAQPNLPGFE
ncbi:MAG TPA: hypothetical protein VFP54_12605 [Acidimicrobiales bacterium]|nr:hypothetical protein [Acidimicrobiales bacterium]